MGADLIDIWEDDRECDVWTDNGTANAGENTDTGAGAVAGTVFKERALSDFEPDTDPDPEDGYTEDV